MASVLTRGPAVSCRTGPRTHSPHPHTEHERRAQHPLRAHCAPVPEHDRYRWSSSMEHARGRACCTHSRAFFAPPDPGAELRSVCTEAGMYAIRARRKVCPAHSVLGAYQCPRTADPGRVCVTLARDGEGLFGGREQGHQGLQEVQLDGTLHDLQLGLSRASVACAFLTIYSLLYISRIQRNAGVTRGNGWRRAASSVCCHAIVVRVRVLSLIATACCRLFGRSIGARRRAGGSGVLDAPQVEALQTDDLAPPRPQQCGGGGVVQVRHL